MEKWDQLDSYLAAVKKRKVVYDPSERGVKITYDSLEQAREEERFQHILQVFENDRNPNQRKKAHQISKIILTEKHTFL